MPRKKPTLADAPPQTPDDDLPETLSERQEIFLACIEGGATYAEATAEVGVHRATSWRWKQDPDFARRYRAARRGSVARLRREAERRAMAGSDRLLIFLLCSYAPEQFQERAVLDHRGKVDLANTIAAARRRVAAQERGGE